MISITHDYIFVRFRCSSYQLSGCKLLSVDQDICIPDSESAEGSLLSSVLFVTLRRLYMGVLKCQ